MPVRSFNEANPPDDRACVRIETVSRSESNLCVQISVFRRIGGRALMRAALALVFSVLASAEGTRAAESHAIAMHGVPAQPADFTHMAYVNPDAPKGGRLTWAILAPFATLIPRFSPGPPCHQIRGFSAESLMPAGNAEPFPLSALLTKT